MRRMSPLRELVEYMKKANFRWAGHVMRRMMTDGQEGNRRHGRVGALGLLRDEGMCLSKHVKQLQQELNDSSHRHLRRIPSLSWMAFAKDRSEWFVASART
ncbi:unnamed protein product [Haemonchus placei]|uniref:Uncharacterized protein n=1 Tax=Haemonchus placei TaxID=6290 RepID=A0A0N4W2V8_HAEPC|nr:unnamed protein product [Haemonchus placei]